MNFRQASVETKNVLTPEEGHDFGMKSSIMPGIEIEYILPYLNNRLSFSTGVSFFTYKASNTYQASVISTITRTVDCQVLEFPLTVKYNIINKSDWSLFLNAGHTMSLTSNSSILTIDDDILDLNTSLGPELGAGISYKKARLAVRYTLPRDMMASYVYWGGDYSALTFKLGYEIF